MAQADRVHSTPPINTSAIDPDIHAPKSPQDALYLPTDITPENVFQAIGRLRKEARDEIDRLIQFLDESENHMELEPEDEADDAETESSLGSLDHMTDQTRWTEGAPDDAEDEHDGGEPDEEGEPSLGSFDGLVDQEHSWVADCVNFAGPDAELDDAESGIGDQDGLDEQVPFRDWQNVGMV
jgi:hypothetical protein